MKVAYIILLTLTLTQAYAFVAPKGDITVQDRPFAFEYVMAELTRVHKAVFQLPFEYEYIKGTLMAEIEAKRKEIAPNYPAREVTGDNQEMVYAHFEKWSAEHPEEFLAYIAYVDQFVKDHQ
jgi:hypothetical protein